MQSLHVVSELPVDSATAWGVFESEAFRTQLAAQTGLKSRILEQHMEGSVEVTTLEYVSGRELPGIAAKVLGTKNLSYTQVNRYDKAASRLTWSVEIPKLSDRVRVEGFTTIVDTASGSHREVKGEIEVKVAFVGGQIEKVVAGEFKKSMEQAVDLARSMMPGSVA